MQARRKVFRVEAMERARPVEGHAHDEIMSELRAMRALIKPSEQVTQQMIDAYKAQIAEASKVQGELDPISDAISRTKTEIAVLHGKSFSGDEMAKVTGELGAVVGGTEEATQQILEAAEAIDNAATALSKVTSPDQQKLLSEEIQERVVSIFEACNFQDLTGQRINKVMTTMKFIENHITVMMDIWGGVDAIKAHAPAIVDTREGDDRLLNGPKVDGDVGHASQDDIDALFD